MLSANVPHGLTESMPLPPAACFKFDLPLSTLCLLLNGCRTFAYLIHLPQMLCMVYLLSLRSDPTTGQYSFAHEASRHSSWLFSHECPRSMPFVALILTVQTLQIFPITKASHRSMRRLREIGVEIGSVDGGE